MVIREDLYYSDKHIWIKVEDDVNAIFGITDFAQDQLGDIVYVEIPKVGERVFKGQDFGSIESVKSVAELTSPLTGTVIEVNEEITSSPELINKDPYGKGWLIKIEMDNPDDINTLLSPEEYQDYIKGLGIQEV